MTRSVFASAFHRLRRPVVAALAVVGAVVLLVTVVPVADWGGVALAGPWNDPAGDTLIVLAGSALDGIVIGENSYWRAVYAVRVYRQGRFRQVVLTGAPSPPMRDFLLAHGVPAPAIQMEAHSVSTRENAIFTADLLRDASPGRLVLLTSDFHMLRAHRTFRKAGLDVLPCPIPDVRKRASRWPGRWPAFQDLVVEIAKIGYYWAQGWI